MGRPKARLLQRIVRLACVMALVVGYVPLQAQTAYAASDVAGGADMTPPLYVLNDHTAYAIHFSMTGLPVSTTLDVNVRLSKTGTAGGFNDARGFTWNPGLSRWVQTREAAANFPAVLTDASGNANGWVYWKCGDETFTGFGAGYPPLGANQGYLTISLQTPTGGGTYNGLAKWTVNILDARTQGAWVHDGIATGAAAAKRAEALKSDETSVSYSLQKTEPNLLDDDSNGVVDDEDYGPAGATGDFRFGVPAGVTMNVKLNQVAWALGQDVTSGPADTDIALGAADHTAPTAPTDLHATPGDNAVALDWTASTDGGSGLSGYRIYRLAPGTYGDLTLQTALPRAIGTVGSTATTFTDSTVTNGNSYSYVVRAIDAATNVSARSNQVSATLPVPDVVPPAAVTDLAAASAGTTNVNLTWTAPGDGGSVGTAAAYDLRYATSPITDDPSFGAATQASGLPAPHIAGSAEAFSVDGLTTGTHYYFALKTRDEANNWSALSNSADATPVAPPSGSMQVDAGAAYTATTSVTIDSAVGGAVDMRFREGAGTWSDWAPYAATAPFTLSAGDGLKTVEAEYRNGGDVVTPLSDSITLDTVAPTGTMAINAGASYTTTRAVSIDSTVTGAVEMRKRNIDGGGNWGSWTAYSASVAHTIQQGDGLKTVEVQYRDAAGNVLDLTDSITLDTVAPTGTIAINAGASYTATRAVSIDSTVTGATEMRKRNIDGGGNWGSWTAYSASVAHSIQQGDGLKTVEVQYRDAAGNVLDLTDSITLDTTKPATGDNAVAAYLGSATIVLSPSDGAGSGIASTWYRFEGAGPWTQGTVATTSLPGAHTLEFYSIDNAGNEETPHRTVAFRVDAATIYQETDPYIAYSGSWTTCSSAAYSGGSLKAAGDAGAGFTVDFTGTAIEWIALTGPTYGKAEVVLDGVLQPDADLFSATYLDQQVVFTAAGLASGPHTLVVSWTGRRNAGAWADNISLDAIRVAGVLTQAPTTYQETDPDITYGGTWASFSSAAYSGGSLKAAGDAGAGFTVDFTGTAVEWIAFTGPTYGKAQVVLDGVLQPDADLFSATYLDQQVVFSAVGLTSGPHTLVVTWTGRRNAGAWADNISLDAIRVAGMLTQAPTTYQETNPFIAYSGSWASFSSPAYSGGTLKTAGDAGAGFTVDFTGTAVEWIAFTGPTYGKAEVTLDGVLQPDADLYSASYLTQQVVFSAAGLASGPHTLVVSWTGRRNPSAWADNISLDAIRVIGVLTPAGP